MFLHVINQLKRRTYSMPMLGRKWVTSDSRVFPWDIRSHPALLLAWMDPWRLRTVASSMHTPLSHLLYNINIALWHFFLCRRLCKSSKDKWITFILANLWTILSSQSSSGSKKRLWANISRSTTCKSNFK